MASQILTSSQTVTASYADMETFTLSLKTPMIFNIWMDITLNNSEDITFRLLTDPDFDTAIGSIDYPLPLERIKRSRTELVALEKVIKNSSFNGTKAPIVSFEVKNSIPILKIQVKAGTLGGTAAVINTAEYTLGDNK